IESGSRRRAAADGAARRADHARGALLFRCACRDRRARAHPGSPARVRNDLSSGRVGPAGRSPGLGESVEECLIREVAEETGLAIGIDRMLGLNKAIAEPYIQALYACSASGASRPIRLRPREHSDARWVRFVELGELGELIPYLDAIIRRGWLDFLK